MVKLDVTLPAGVDPAVALALGTLEAGQARLFDAIKDLTTEQLERVPAGLSNSITTLVVHVYGNEVRMAHRLTGQALPPDLAAEYLLDQPQNPLPTARGETVDSLRAKAAKGRGFLKEALAQLRPADLDKEMALGPERSATFRWALAMVPQHQTQHLGHIQMIKKLL